MAASSLHAAPDTDAFEDGLRRDGYLEILTRSMPAGHVEPPHAHAFDVRALVLEGEITLTADDGSRTYRAGDVFTMEASREHAERIGAAGVRYLVGRKR